MDKIKFTKKDDDYEYFINILERPDLYFVEQLLVPVTDTGRLQTSLKYFYKDDNDDMKSYNEMLSTMKQTYALCEGEI